MNRLRAATAASICAALAIACGGGGVGPSKGPKVVVLGFDGLDYALTRQLIDEGRLPNFARLEAMGTFGPLETTIPPQSPVAWSSFITGMDPGGHGIFDFLHRDPETLIPYPSTAGSSSDGRSLKVGRWQFPLTSGEYTQFRQGTPFWEMLEEHGVRTQVIRMPANFPVSGTASRELSGMGTTDVKGTEGWFTFYTSELFAFADQEITGGEIVELDVYDNVVEAELLGPDNPLLREPTQLTAPFAAYLDPEKQSAKIELGDQEIVLQVGEWSDWLEVEFEMMPTQHLRGICRMYLRALEPEFELYVSPIDHDPMAPAAPISTPPDFAAELAEAVDRFYTEGMPEDTKTLTDGVFTPDEFLAQAKIAGDEVAEQYGYVLDQYLEQPGGLLFYYFGNVDQIGHVRWRSRDPEHPVYDPELDAAHADLIPTLYEGLDAIVGQTLDRLEAEAGLGDGGADEPLLIVMSDHGFASWRRAFHLNAWLLEKGYLAARSEDSYGDGGFLLNVDWERTRAYGIGFSGLYVNLRGRERDGVVTAAERLELVEELKRELLAVVDPETGEPAVTEVLRREDYAFQGQTAIGPDLIVGYARGYRVATESASGTVVGETFSDNDSAWSGDHMMDHRVVPGVLFTSRPLGRPAVGITDLAASILAEYGLEGFPRAGDGESPQDAAALPASGGETPSSP